MIAGETIKLRDREYVIAPLPISALKPIWDKLERVVRFTGEPFSDVPSIVEDAADVVLAAMTNGNNPEMTRERLMRDVLDYANYRQAFFAALAVSGVRLERAEAGKSLALAMVAQTGTQSTAT
jgi:hypothetical protein